MFSQTPANHFPYPCVNCRSRLGHSRRDQRVSTQLCKAPRSGLNREPPPLPMNREDIAAGVATQPENYHVELCLNSKVAIKNNAPRLSPHQFNPIPYRSHNGPRLYHLTRAAGNPVLDIRQRIQPSDHHLGLHLQLDQLLRQRRNDIRER